jgi:hypothetical protein
MNLLDNNLFAEGLDDSEAQGGWGEEDRDFLEGLEEKAKEIDDAADSID